MSTLPPPTTSLMFTAPPAMTSLMFNDDNFMFDNMGQDDLPPWDFKDPNNTTTTTIGNIH